MILHWWISHLHLLFPYSFVSMLYVLHLCLCKVLQGSLFLRFAYRYKCTVIYPKSRYHHALQIVSEIVNWQPFHQGLKAFKLFLNGTNAVTISTNTLHVIYKMEIEQFCISIMLDLHYFSIPYRSRFH